MNFREYLNSLDLGRHYLNEGVIEVKQIGNYIKLVNELKSYYGDIQIIAKKYGSLKNFRNDFSDLLGEFADNLTDLQKKAVVERPKNKKELMEIIREIIAEKGPNCDLNFIDVSNITDMSYLFWKTKFDGDISKWDVSNVTSMRGMFQGCPFNGDISKWNVSSVENMAAMFMFSEFNGDISKWDVSNVESMGWMFTKCPFNQDISKWNVRKVKGIKEMFDNCPIKDEYKPHFR